MNVGVFRRTLDLMIQTNRELKLQVILDSIRDNLINLVASPAQPTHQSSLAQSLEDFSSASGKLAEILTPSDTELIGELGGQQYFDPTMATDIKAVIATNAMTPSVASTYVQKFSNDRSTYLATIIATRDGLKELQIEASTLESGNADASFVIPIEIFEGQLGTFAKELTYINRLLSHLSEAVAGKRESVGLESLSSSIPTVTVHAGLETLGALADVVGKFLSAWDKVQKFRDARHQLTELGLSKKALEEVSEQITTTIDEVVEESVELCISGFSGESGRKNELKNALRQDVNRLYAQLERGLVVQFNAAVPESEDGESPSLTKLKMAATSFRFPPISEEPVLLPASILIEGDMPEIKVIRKKTTKKKTTTTTKSV